MNFKHLYYFWAAAKSGGIMRAGEQLHTTPQTLSGQIKLLEAQLGCALFRKSGRGLELTEDGRIALDYADQIFALSAELKAAIGKARVDQAVLDFRVGISDSVPKAIAYRLLEPALSLPEPVRLICHEGDFQSLLAQIAVHSLDLVIADEPMSKQTSVKAFNHALGNTAMSFFATPELKSTFTGDFPHCLDGHRRALADRTASSTDRLSLVLCGKPGHGRTEGRSARPGFRAAPAGRTW